MLYSSISPHKSSTVFVSPSSITLTPCCSDSSTVIGSLDSKILDNHPNILSKIFTCSATFSQILKDLRAQLVQAGRSCNEYRETARAAEVRAERAEESARSWQRRAIVAEADDERLQTVDEWSRTRRGAGLQAAPQAPQVQQATSVISTLTVR